jgi:FkbM family methyltransferase
VGANRGTYSFPILRKLRKPGLLYLFEPIPQLFNYLVKGLGKKDTVEIYSFACGDKQGIKGIKMPINNGELGLGSASFVNSFKHFETISVNVIAIDSLKIKKVNFIKIDVEGFEAEVVRGLLRPVELLSLEFSTDTKDMLIAALRHLDQLESYLFQFSAEESFQLFDDGWMGLAAIEKQLTSFSGLEWGDVYCRRIRV